MIKIDRGVGRQWPWPERTVDRWRVG